MVLPRSIPSPIAAQIAFPTALAVGGGSVEPVVGPNSELLSKLKAVVADQAYYDMDGLKWKESLLDNDAFEGNHCYYIGIVKNQHAYDVMVTIIYQTIYWTRLTPELRKFRLTPGEIKTVAGKNYFSWCPEWNS